MFRRNLLIFARRHPVIVESSIVLVSVFIGLMVAIFSDIIKGSGSLIFITIIITISFTFLQVLNRQIDKLDRNTTLLYKFSTKTPKLIGSSNMLDDGTFGAHQSDKHASTMIINNLRTVGIQANSMIICSDDDAPKSIQTENELILICGPSRNALANQLNSYIRDNRLNAFFFNNILPKGRVYITPPPKYIISHGRFGEIDLPHDPNLDKSTEYGIIFVGQNPAKKDKWMIWGAGYRSLGTIGAAQALVDPKVQSQIISELSLGSDYVSLLVLYKPSSVGGKATGDFKSILMSSSRL